MSFIKDLFNKRKDAKYGKGHKLGETPTTDNTPASQQQHRQPPAPSSSSHSSAAPSEASLRAGQAALNRMQQQNRPKTSTTARAAAAEVSKEVEEAKHSAREIEKALELKTHYFGDHKVTIVNNPLSQKVYFKSSLLQQSRKDDGRYVASGEKLTREQVEDRIEQALLEQLNDEPVLIAVSLLFTANHKANGGERLHACVETINRFIDNILKAPDETKYHKLRVENAVFKEKVYKCKYADLVLRHGGFSAKSLPAPPTTTTTGDDNDDVVVFEDYFVFDGDLDKLRALKSALSLAEPIVPELDRDLKCYRLTGASSSTQSAPAFNNFSLDSDFYNLSIDELRKEQKLRNEAVEKAGMLRTKAMRERDVQLELRQYNYCMVRVRMNDTYMVQAVFRANERLGDVYALIADECLEVNVSSSLFELHGHSLKKGVEANATLAECGLAPAALLNFKWTGDDERTNNNNTRQVTLKPQLVKNALKF